MKHLSLLAFFILTSFVLITSCKKDEDVQPDPTPAANPGVYITNEGTFGYGNASVSFYDFTSSTVTEDLFSDVNNRPLGDVCQSMYTYNGKIYIVVNNSQKIEVVTADSFKSVATINGFTSPRYFLPVSASKAYVTDLFSNNISIVDLNSNSITGSITVNGWTEQLIEANGKVYVTNESSKEVSIIDPTTDAVVDSIAIGFGSNSIREDKNGKLWILCGGDWTNSIPSSFYWVDPATNAIEDSFVMSAPGAWRLCMNGTQDTLYYLYNDVYRMAVTDAALPSTAFVPFSSGTYLYGVGVDPTSNEVYVSDALNFTSNGKVYRYYPNGTLRSTFTAGVAPGDFYFKE